jgi:O-antigen/teichoic acid export membrane protein
MSTLNLSLVGLGLRIAVTMVVLVNTLLIARVLGPAAFGEYFLFFRLISVLGAFADFGLPQSVNAFYGRHEESRASIHRIVLRLVPILWLVVTIIGGFIVWLGGDLLLPHLMPLLTLAAFAVLPLSMYANLWNGMMLGAGRIWRVNVVQFVMCSLSLVLTVVVVVTLHGGVVGAALCYTAVMLVQSVVMVALESRSTPKQALSELPPKSEQLSEISRQMIHFSLRGYLGSISALLWTRMPVFILNVTHGPTAVGIFSLSQQVVEKMLFPVQSVRDAVYQKMSVLPSQSAYTAFDRYVRLTVWGMFVLVIAAGLGTPLIISLLLGPQYTEAIQLARILLLGAVFAAVSLLLDAFFVNQLHRPGLVSVLSWFRLIVGLTLVAALVPGHGAKGIAAAIVFTQIVSTLVYITIYVKITRTRVANLLFIGSDDLELLKHQVYMLFRPRRDGISQVGSAD